MGEEDENTLNALMYVAMSFAVVGDRNASLKTFDQVCNEFEKVYGEMDLMTLNAYYRVAMFVNENLNHLQYALVKAKKAYEIGLRVLGQDHRFVHQAHQLFLRIHSSFKKGEPSWKSTMAVIASVKAQRNYERLLIGETGRRVAEKAVASYAKDADLKLGFAVQQTGHGFLGLGRCRGVLLTEHTLYSDQLPPKGIAYSSIQSVSLEDCTICLTLTDGVVHTLDIGASGPDMAFVLQAACDAVKEAAHG